MEKERLECSFCSWIGHDVHLFGEDSYGNQVYICTACASLPMDIKKVKDLHPMQLIPIMRSCMAQVMGDFIDSSITKKLLDFFGYVMVDNLSSDEKASLVDKVYGFSMKSQKDTNKLN